MKETTKSSSRRSFLFLGAAAASVALTHSVFGTEKRVRLRTPDTPAGAAGAIWLGGDLQVNRIGLGTAGFTGPNRWGDPSDPESIRALLRRAIDLGVNLLDTADVYGPYVSERLIREALYPYPPDLVIATKGGQTHDTPGPNEYDARPERLRAACESSLKRLGLEQIPLYYLHSPDKTVPYEDSVGELTRLQEEGKIRHIGVSQVDASLLAKARSVATVVAVQNQYNVSSGWSNEILEICEREHMVFVPFGPLGMRNGRRLNTTEDPRLAALLAITQERQISLAQGALAWLLARSPMLLPIPGTTKIAHLEENVAAANIRFSEQEMQQIG